MEGRTPRREDQASRALLKRGLAGAALGGGLLALLLLMAGAPPFDFALAQEGTAAPAAQLIEGARGSPYWLPPNASEHGPQVDFLFYLITAITGVAFIAVEVLLVWFGIRYRHKPGRRAIYSHGNHRLEVAWTVAPAVLLLVLVVLSKSTWSQIRYGPPPGDATHVEVTGQQFVWNFKLPGSGERFGKEDFAPQGQFHVPLGKWVTVDLRSKDVLHSFFLPNMRVKLDAVPGMTGKLWFKPTVPGTFEVVCAELCGAEHWKMRATLTVDGPEDYEKWLQNEAKFAPDKPK